MFVNILQSLVLQLNVQLSRTALQADIRAWDTALWEYSGLLKPTPSQCKTIENFTAVVVFSLFDFELVYWFSTFASCVILSNDWLWEEPSQITFLSITVADGTPNKIQKSFSFRKSCFRQLESPFIMPMYLILSDVLFVLMILFVVCGFHMKYFISLTWLLS